MRLSEAEFSGGLPVDGYGPGFFRIGGQVHRGAVLIGPERVQAWGGVDDLAPLLALADAVDVLFLGLGETMVLPPAGLRGAIEGAGIGLEPMASLAAARSYNVALSEGRRVAVALLPVGAAR